MAGVSPDFKRLRVVVAATSESFEVLVLDGMAAGDVLAAVQGRAGAGGAVVPLSGALPGGTTVYLHARARGRAASAARRPLDSECSANGGGPRGESRGDADDDAARATLDAMPLEARPCDGGDHYFALGSDEAGGRESALEAGGGGRESALESQLTAVERFSRLTTELANERTLLAWIRTTLASMRTAYSLSSLESNDGDFWRVLTESSELIICLTVIATAFNGIFRYQKIKNALLSKVPLRQFGRRTLRPYNGLVSLVAVAVAITIFQRRLVTRNH